MNELKAKFYRTDDKKNAYTSSLGQNFQNRVRHTQRVTEDANDPMAKAE